MKNFDVHGKLLPAPSFFQVYNYGGGNGDKDREIVYAELTKDTPALVNYYYINNRYLHRFKAVRLIMCRSIPVSEICITISDKC